MDNVTPTTTAREALKPQTFEQWLNENFCGCLNESQTEYIAKHAGEFALANAGEVEPHWFCEHCQCEVQPSHVTHDERHGIDSCLRRVTWREKDPEAENTKLRADLDRVKEELAALGDLAVGEWDSATVGKVDALVPDAVKYKDQLRALFVDIPTERDRLREENERLAHDLKELDQAGYRDGQKLANENNQLRARIAQLESTPPASTGWVSVEERLPKNSYPVLIYVSEEEDGFDIAGFRGDRWCCEWRTVRLEHVTHWHPLPAAPGATPSAERTDAERVEKVTRALKLAYARGHFCDDQPCPGCECGSALEAILGRKVTQEECEEFAAMQAGGGE